MQIVHFHQSNSCRVIYTMDDRSVVARWKVCDDCRFAWVTRCVAAVYDILDLVLGDNPADDRSLPIIVAANQRSSAVVQFQCGISHWIRNAILTELRANGANDHSLWLSALNNEPADHHVVARLHKGARTDIAQDRIGTGAKIVHFYESNSSGAAHSTHDRGVVTRWKVCDNSRFAWVTRCVAAVYDTLDLVLGDNPADDRSLPVIIRGNQRSGAIVQFQCGISHWIRNAILTELRANGANDHSLWLSALNNEPADHHVVARLHKGARTDIAQDRIGTGAKIVHLDQSNSSGAAHSTHDRGVVTRWKVCDNSRFCCVTRCVAAVRDILDLVLGDNPADDRSLPVIIRGNQRSGAIVQFQCGISHRIRNAILTELRANGANNYPFGGRALHDKPANHHVIAGLNKGARGDVAELCAVGCPVEPVHLIGLRRACAASCSPTAPTRAYPEAATRILPGGRVIRCDRAIGPAPFAQRGIRHVGLDLNPVRTGSKHCGSGQV